LRHQAFTELNGLLIGIPSPFGIGMGYSQTIQDKFGEFARHFDGHSHLFPDSSQDYGVLVQSFDRLGSVASPYELTFGKPGKDELRQDCSKICFELL
jgi:hypothetical protein